MPTYRTLCRRAERYALNGQAYRRWYRVSRAVIHRLSRHSPFLPLDHDKEFYRLCDLVAITSPRVSVKQNLQWAWGEFRGEPKPAGMIRSTRVALDHYHKTGEIRGAKTSRFAQVLRGDDRVVVVDSWMARALSIPDNQARNKASQELAERVVEHVWRVRDTWTMAETQAAIWAGVIRATYKDGTIPIMRTADVGLYSTGPGGRLTTTPF